MPAKRRASGQRDPSSSRRYRRYAQYLRRWENGEPIKTYDSRWLALLQEQLTAAHAEEV
jgi:hypothetical protein